MYKTKETKSYCGSFLPLSFFWEIHLVNCVTNRIINVNNSCKPKSGKNTTSPSNCFKNTRHTHMHTKKTHHVSCSECSGFNLPLGKVCINKLRSGVLTGGLSQAKKQVWEVQAGEVTDKIYCVQNVKTHWHVVAGEQAGSLRSLHWNLYSVCD